MESGRSRARIGFRIHRAVWVASLALIGAALLAQPARASNIAKLGRECREGKQKACEELTRIATEGKYPMDRESAIHELSDQVLLLRIALQDPDVSVRRAAADKLDAASALEFLKSFSMETLDDINLSSLALSKIQDPSLVFQAALDCKEVGMRKMSTDKLTDQSLLSRLALESTDAAVQSKAVNKLTDQKAIETVATGSKVAAVRAAALWKLTNSSVVESIEKNDADENVRNAAKAALDWETVRAEHEAYVWKASAPAATGSPLPRWKVSGVLGTSDRSWEIITVVQQIYGEKAFAGETSLSVAPVMNSRFQTARLDESTSGNGPLARSMMATSIGANWLLERDINEESAGYVPWWIDPEEDQDACILESSAVPPELGVALKAAMMKLEFRGVIVSGKGVWEVNDEKAYVFFQPKLHVNRYGQLALGGTVAAFTYVAGTPGQLAMKSSTLEDAPVTVSGTIRVAPDHVTQVGGGYELQGGGLQFDETGVFLMVGTKYRKRPQQIEAALQAQ